MPDITDFGEAQRDLADQCEVPRIDFSETSHACQPFGIGRCVAVPVAPKQPDIANLVRGRAAAILGPPRVAPVCALAGTPGQIEGDWIDSEVSKWFCQIVRRQP